MPKNIKKTIDPVEAEPTVVEKQEITQIVKQEQEIVKQEADIDAYLTLRQEFIKKVNAICVEGKDYHVIQGKKSLAKGGAEKIASIFKWTAKFEKDSEAIEMLGEIKGLVAFKCTLMNGHFVGEGRGATTLVKNGGDPNKTLKMAQKSAFIDAVLRASGLSDFFTQDLEDMPRESFHTYTPEKPATRQNYAPRTPYTKPADTVNAYNSLAERIGQANTVDSLDLLAKEVMIAFNNKKITQGQLEMLKSIGTEIRNKLSPESAEIKKIG